MAELDYIIDPPTRARKLVIGMLLTGFITIVVFCAWYFLIHVKTTDSLTHEGHFGCHFLHDNPLLLFITLFGVLVGFGGRDRPSAR